MTALAQYTSGPASGAQLRLLWSAHVDALERHLSAKMWALTAAAVVVTTYPIARIVIPAMLHAVVPDAAVPDMVRTLLSLIGV
jgi:hypothetical protein